MCQIESCAQGQIKSTTCPQTLLCFPRKHSHFRRWCIKAWKLSLIFFWLIATKAWQKVAAKMVANEKLCQKAIWRSALSRWASNFYSKIFWAICQCLRKPGASTTVLLLTTWSQRSVPVRGIRVGKTSAWATGFSVFFTIQGNTMAATLITAHVPGTGPDSKCSKTGHPVESS